MKRFIAILLSLLFAGAIVFGWPLLIDGKSVDANILNEKSLVKQEVISYDDVEKSYTKIYDEGRLIGVVTDYDKLLADVKGRYAYYEDEFPNTELGLGEDVYAVPEKSTINFENVDDEIFEYLVAHNLIGIKTTAIEFSTEDGVYERIYVKDINDFYKARDNFILNFVSEDSLSRLRSGGRTSTLEDFGSVETGLQMLEKITNKEAIVSPNKIFCTEEEIYEFLCYGRNEEREYYTTVEGDTLQGVGYYAGDMSPRQLVMLNPDILSSVNQVITPGMTLNITYYTSPITIVVTKEKLSQEIIYPEAPLYIQDPDLKAGVSEIRVKEENGSKNSLYEETWINGVRETGTLKSETITKEPVQGVVAIGTNYGFLAGTGNFQWPCDNPVITCLFMCRANHTGIDLVNAYVGNANIYASDSGVISEMGYLPDMGYYIYVDHQNGFNTIYMHLNEFYCEVGQSVSRGQLIAQMGNTGRSYGIHLHFTIEYEGERLDPCNGFLPCSLIASE